MATLQPAPDEARAFLVGHLGRDVDAVEWVGAGAWSSCFAFEVDGEPRVVRFGRYLDDFEKDARAAGFATKALPVPAVFEVGRAFDGYFAISSRARGEMLESLDEEGWMRVLPSLFSALDVMRSIDSSSTHGYGPWDAKGDGPYRTWPEFLAAVVADGPERRTHGWTKRLLESREGKSAFDAGLSCMTRLVDALPAPGRSVVHADLINRNVLVEGGRITAVLDWGCSFYGDFLYDVAWLAFWAPWHPGLSKIDIVECARRHYAAIGLPVPGFEARLRCCMLHIGLDHLAYNAHLGDRAALADVVRRMFPLLD